MCTRDAVDEALLRILEARTQCFPGCRAVCLRLQFSSQHVSGASIAIKFMPYEMSKGKRCFSKTARHFFPSFFFSLFFFFHVMPSWRIFATLDKYFSVTSNGKELITSQEGHCCFFMRFFCKADELGILVHAQYWAFAPTAESQMLSP